MGKGLIAVIAVVVVIGLFALIFFGQYVSVRNTLVSKNEAVKAAWSQVDIVLQRRADLIPNLVETVKGYAKQEQTVFGDIAKARSAIFSCGLPAGKDRCQQSIGRSHRPPAPGGGKLSPAQVERKLPAIAGRTRRHRESHRRRAQALQRNSAGLQHLRPAISSQHFCRLGRIQTQ